MTAALRHPVTLDSFSESGRGQGVCGGLLKPVESAINSYRTVEIYRIIPNQQIRQEHTAPKTKLLRIGITGNVRIASHTTVVESSQVVADKTARAV